jgi:hypothetical protein
MVRQNPSIKGIEIADITVLLSQFADDTEFFLDGRKESFCACVHTLQDFARISGLNINYEKSSAVWIGSRINCTLKYLTEFDICWNPTTFKILGICFTASLENMIGLNYDHKLQNIRKLFAQWSRRNLTPFGKITVIKTLALPTLTYLFMNLPDPTEEFLKEMTKMMYEFLWNGKPDKINRVQMCLGFEKGGLKMIDVKSFLSALKINCLKRILCAEGKITNILYTCCPLTKKLSAIGSEIGHVIQSRISNPFWTDVFKHYMALYRLFIPSTFSDFVSECIHYNFNICRNNEIVCLKTLLDNGVTAIGHLFSRHGILSFHDFQGKYPDIDMDCITYQGILSAIKQYQSKLQITTEEDFVVDEHRVWKCMSKGGSKHIYLTLVENKCHGVNKSLTKWNQVFETQINHRRLFISLKQTTNDSSLRWLQYKIMYRIIPTNRLLSIMKIVDSSLCSFCSNNEETIVHLFWECEKIQVFWTDVQVWLHQNFNHCNNVTFSKQLVILGYKNNFVSDRIFNLFLLIAKYHILCSKWNNNLPHINVYVRMLQNHFEAEKYYSYLCPVKKNKFICDWQQYKSFFEQHNQ